MRLKSVTCNQPVKLGPDQFHTLNAAGSDSGRATPKLMPELEYNYQMQVIEVSLAGRDPICIPMSNVRFFVPDLTAPAPAKK